MRAPNLSRPQESKNATRVTVNTCFRLSRRHKKGARKRALQIVMTN